jgi:hypothetical protein
VVFNFVEPPVRVKWINVIESVGKLHELVSKLGVFSIRKKAMSKSRIDDEK